MSVEALGKSFGARTVLQDLSLYVHPGEIVGLLGSDGQGKSLCFNLIMGFVRPDAGRILLGNIDATHLSPERRARLGLTYLPQDPSVFHGMTVEQNIAAVVELWEPAASARAGRVEELLSAFQLGHLRAVPAPRLSGGERRRCEIARSVAMSPAIMLLDEPFAGIDPLAIEDIKRVLRALKAQNVGLLISDHNLHDLLELVERVYVIHGGHVIYTGTPGQMVENAAVCRFYLGKEAERLREVPDNTESRTAPARAVG